MLDFFWSSWRSKLCNLHGNRWILVAYHYCPWLTPCSGHRYNRYTPSGTCKADVFSRVSRRRLVWAQWFSSHVASMSYSMVYGLLENRLLLCWLLLSVSILASLTIRHQGMYGGFCFLCPRGVFPRTRYIVQQSPNGLRTLFDMENGCGSILVATFLAFVTISFKLLPWCNCRNRLLYIPTWKRRMHVLAGTVLLSLL